MNDPFGWVGHTLGEKLRVEALVAEGGFGVVYRARHLGFDERVALKCLKLPARLEADERDQFLSAFLAEGKLLHRLSRSNVGIVQALDIGAAMSPSGVWTPYLALEWLDGESLEDEVTRRGRERAPRRSLPEVIALLESAAGALAAAHEQGVAHRDIKPANLFLTEVAGRRIVKIFDFGIAKVMSEVGTTTRALAETGASINAFTPQYGAPEQFDRHFGATGPWTDVFGLALVVVELLTSRSALDGGNTMQLYISSTNAKRRPTPRALGLAVSDAVEAALARAVAVEPRDRYPTARAFWDALLAASALAGEQKPQTVVATSSGEIPRGVDAQLARTEPVAPPSTGAPSSSAPTLRRPLGPGEELEAPISSAVTAPQGKKRTDIARGALVFVIAMMGVALVGGGILLLSLASSGGAMSAAPSPPSTESALALPAASLVVASEVPTPVASVVPLASASASASSELAPQDHDFVDKKKGEGWAERCSKHIGKEKLDWAKAACDQGLAMDPPPPPDTRGALFYNLGVIEQKRGNVKGAREYYKKSKGLRPSPEVEMRLGELAKR